MSDIQRKRVALKTVYPGDRWAYKVDHMSDEQVVAVFLAMKRQKKL